MSTVVFYYRRSEFTTGGSFRKHIFIFCQVILPREIASNKQKPQEILRETVFGPSPKWVSWSTGSQGKSIRIEATNNEMIKNVIEIL